MKQNYAEAMAWYKKSAEQGGSIEQFKVGEFYERGLGVQKDRGEAIAWYKKAADQGYEDAKKALERLEREP